MSRTTILALSTLCLFAASACDLDTDKPDTNEAISETAKETEEKSPETEDKNLENEDENLEAEENSPETVDTSLDAGTSTLSSPTSMCIGGTQIIATRYDTVKRCHYYAERVGCTLDRTTVCAAGITYAKDLQGNRWQLKNGCIPKSWKSFRPALADTLAMAGPLCSDAAPCGGLYNVNKGCRYSAERRAETGCTSYGAYYDYDYGKVLCTQVFTCVKSPAGNVFMFSNGCIPKPFSNLERASCNSDTAKWPLCP